MRINDKLWWFFLILGIVIIYKIVTLDVKRITVLSHTEATASSTHSTKETNHAR